jgi:putative endonuclease
MPSFVWVTLVRLGVPSARFASLGMTLPVEVKTFYIYMVSNRSRSVLYIGVTNSLERRLWFHANAKPGSFVKRYRCDRLVYYESFNTAGDAISREKEIKGWRREKKNDLVRTLNPLWKDLGAELFEPER